MAASHFPAKSKPYTSSSDFGHLYHARATVSFDNLFSVVLHYDHATAPNDKTLEDRDMTMFDMGVEYHFYGSDMMIDDVTEEIARMCGHVVELEDAAAHTKKDKMVGFMWRRIDDEGLGGKEREVYHKKSEE
ncbi:hypothetical protein JHK87_034141 [Glycine soja]|nr:hypothetical protein JHK87_034141 [Glycine soja]